MTTARGTGDGNGAVAEELRLAKACASASGSETSHDVAPAGGQLTCAYCGGHADGNFSIHRDGFAVGPEVELCDECVEDPELSCFDIWDEIARPSDESSFAHRPKMPAAEAAFYERGKDDTGCDI